MKLKRPELLITKNYINGEWVSSKDYISIQNPFTQQEITKVSSVNNQDIDLAINAAHEAFIAWSNTDAKTRSKILEQWYHLILENLEDLANILTLEQGKPLEDARKEILYGANFVKWFAEEAKKIRGTIVEHSKPNQKIFIEYEPIGVVGAITPWNFPNAMITRKVAPAIAAGCTIILKPSELTPLSAFALAQLSIEAGLPKGVLNIITGNADLIGTRLCESDVVKKISFTGSTRIGKLLYSKCAEKVKKLSLELGGNAPFIVFEDTNIDNAVNGLLAAKLRSSGQACTAANRIFLQKSIKNKHLEKFIEVFTKAKVGDGFAPHTQIGPLINQTAIDKINRLVNDAVSKGAKIISGGKHIAGTLLYSPTILDNCTQEMDIFKEEIFDPVVAIYDFENEQELINSACNTEYGLAAYFYTDNHERVWRVAKALNFGIIGINEVLISNEYGAFGGRKESGFGIEGSHLGIYEYLCQKYICMAY
jgi:succinate-semialdehyde dehydrogenase/glutarate-semialdehyde dehydrogenase